jgi:hypothetical protein
MTFSSASVSAREVEDVAATAAGVGGLRAVGGGKAACWRVAGAIAGAGKAWAAVFAAAVVEAVLTVFFLGTTLRAIGRGLGSGTFDLAAASAAQADNPTASARVVAIAVDCNAAARADWVTAFLCDESRDDSRPRSI